MKRTFSMLSLGVLLAAFTTISANAACGGGGYKAVSKSTEDSTYGSSSDVTKNETVHASVNTSVASSPAVYSTRTSNTMSARKSEKLASRQRDVDKAQAKLAACTGDCESERRKLDEAMAKYTREQNSND